MIIKDSLIILIILQFIFIGVNAVCAAAEIAVITMNNNKLLKLAAAGDKRAKRLVKITNQPAGFLATIQVGITLINLLSAAVATENFSGRLTQGLMKLGLNMPETLINNLSIVIITIILTYFTVLIGELVPKRIAMKKAEKIALGMSGVLSVFSKIFIPAVWLFTVSTNGILKILGINPVTNEEKDAEEEIRLILEVGTMQGTILTSEHEMIKNVFEFNDISAKEIMIPRKDVSMLSTDETVTQWESIINRGEHAKYPVYAKKEDSVIGVLYVKEFFRLKDRTHKNILKNAVRPAYFTSQNVRADILFKDMQKKRSHFAIVIDGSQKMIGIVTMKDLLEQIVGDLDDEEQQV